MYPWVALSSCILISFHHIFNFFLCFIVFVVSFFLNAMQYICFAEFIWCEDETSLCRFTNAFVVACEHKVHSKSSPASVSLSEYSSAKNKEESSSFEFMSDDDEDKKVIFFALLLLFMFYLFLVVCKYWCIDESILKYVFHCCEGVEGVK